MIVQLLNGTILVATTAIKIMYKGSIPYLSFDYNKILLSDVVEIRSN